MNEMQSHILARALADAFSPRRKRYEYVCVSLETMIALHEPRLPDAYVSNDGGVSEANAALSNGYRWVRSDTLAGVEYAILEKEITR